MKTQFIATIVILSALLSTAGTFVHWAAFRLAGIGIEKVNIFFGRPLFTLRWAGVPVEIGWWLAGSSVKYDMPQYHATNRFLRLGITLSGLIPALLVGALVLGLPATLHHFARGFVEIPAGVLHPRTVAPELVQRLYGVFLRSNPTAAGILAVKLMAFGFLPLAGFTATQAVCSLIDKPEDRRWIVIYMTASALCMYAIAIFWLVALAIFAMKRA